MCIRDRVNILHHRTVKLAKSRAGIYRVPDSVRFDQVQTTDVPEPVAVHLWLDRTITKALMVN